jgi:hypothetical protein
VTRTIEPFIYYEKHPREKLVGVLVFFGFLMRGSEQCLHNLFSIENIFLFIEIVDEII